MRGNVMVTHDSRNVGILVRFKASHPRNNWRLV